MTGSARFTEAFYGGVLLPCRVRVASHAADLWHHGAESQRLVLSRHDVLPEITDPGACVPGEGAETVTVFLVQRCD